MEALVAHHSGHIIVRLPQVAGRTPNLYTLLNFLHRHICRGERFTLYKNASRNIIDVDDVVTIVKALVLSKSVRGITLNVANPTSSPVSHLVATMEKVAGKPALVDVVNKGEYYEIDISRAEERRVGKEWVST